jgi:hypothetical protein
MRGLHGSTQHREELVLGAILRLGRRPGRLVHAHDLRLLFAEPTRGEIRGDLAGADRQESQMVVRVGVGISAADEEHALHLVERDEGNRQVRGAGHEVGDIRRQPVRRRRQLVRDDGQEARQHLAQAPFLRDIGLDHESRCRGRRRHEERAAVGGHDTAEQPERAPQPELGVERRIEALRDVVERAGDRYHRPRVFFPDERRETANPPAGAG